MASTFSIKQTVIVLGITDHLQFQLFPPQNGLFYQHLANETGSDATTDYYSQFLDIIDQPATGTTHGIGRTNDYRITKLGGNLFGILDSVDGLALWHLDIEAVHRFLESNPVFTPLDSVSLNTDNLDAVLFKDTGA